MVGLLDDVSRAIGATFCREGDVVALLGNTRDEMGASEYLGTLLGREEGPCPSLDLVAARALVNLLVELIRDGYLSSAHDLSEGGFAVAVAEACFGPALLGARLNVTTPLPATRFLFSESAPRAIVSFPAGGEMPLLDAARRYGVPTALIGRVVPGILSVGVNGTLALDTETSALKSTYENAFRNLMEG
jgi:phosphoribosylformylglycinamidine (FGAM) synthase-like enzyme